eukprot:1788740-Rhodomonas_salina.4
MSPEEDAARKALAQSSSPDFTISSVRSEPLHNTVCGVSLLWDTSSGATRTLLCHCDGRVGRADAQSRSHMDG